LPQYYGGFAVKVVDIIRADKRDVDIGPWNTGKIPHASWPLRQSSLHLGRGFSWRVAKFEALGKKFRVLIAISAEKETYRAMLAVEDGRQLKVLCHHELHTSHWNWHCHFHGGRIDDVMPGVLRDNDTFRAWPKFVRTECSVPFTVTKESAVTVAAARYRFKAQGELL
jgi:hypothetical protein